MEAKGERKKRRSDRAGRPRMRSPGRPTEARREERQRFWAAIARGVPSEDAAVAAGVSPAVGTRWFRHSGGMPSVTLQYRATTAQWHADRRARRPKMAKLARYEPLRRYVQDRLAGTVTSPDGRRLVGPAVRWIGRRHGRRQHRRWATAWSPEQIARRLPLDFPDDESMRVSHEAIYQALYIHGRGALRRELTACLRTGRTRVGCFGPSTTQCRELRSALAL